MGKVRKRIGTEPTGNSQHLQVEEMQARGFRSNIQGCRRKIRRIWCPGIVEIKEKVFKQGGMVS